MRQLQQLQQLQLGQQQTSRILAKELLAFQASSRSSPLINKATIITMDHRRSEGSAN